LKETFPTTLNVLNPSALAKAQLGLLEEAAKDFALREEMNARDLKGWSAGIDTWIYALNSFIYTKLGRTADARSMLEDAEQESKVRYVNMSDIATILMALGEKEGAYEIFERGLETRESSPFYWPWWVFDPVRKEKRFVSILRRAGLPESMVAPGQ